MGRLADLFDNYRGNVEESVKHVLGRADDTIEALRNRVDELEAKLRDVAGNDSSASENRDKAESRNLESKSDGVVTSSQTNNPADTSVAAEADQSVRKNTRSKK